MLKKINNRNWNWKVKGTDAYCRTHCPIIIKYTTKENKTDYNYKYVPEKNHVPDEELPKVVKNVSSTDSTTTGVCSLKIDRRLCFINETLAEKNLLI